MEDLLKQKTEVIPDSTNSLQLCLLRGWDLRSHCHLPEVLH